jgi:hypothetical protein
MKKHKRQYSGMAGKVIKWAESYEEDGRVYIGIHLADNSELTFVLTPQAPEITTEQLKWASFGIAEFVRRKRDTNIDFARKLLVWALLRCYKGFSVEVRQGVPKSGAGGKKVAPISGPIRSASRA